MHETEKTMLEQLYDFIKRRFEEEPRRENVDFSVDNDPDWNYDCTFEDCIRICNKLVSTGVLTKRPSATRKNSYSMNKVQFTNFHKQLHSTNTRADP
jgi:hypothetical protein